MTTILGAAASSLVHSQATFDTVANNIANINTAAFKRSRVVAEGAPTPGIGPEGGRLGVAEITYDAILSPGMPFRTDEPLDFAIADDAYFRARDFDGSSVLTRYGSLGVDSNGNVSAYGGRPLDPPIVVPEGLIMPVINAAGVVSAMDPATGSLQPLGQLTLVRLPNPAGLQYLGTGLYRETANSGAPAEGVPGDDAFAPLTVGALESSNVDLAEEFTQMLIAQRAYQASAKTFSIGDQMLALATNITR